MTDDMSQKQWRSYVQEQFDQQADRAKWLSKWLFRLIPVSLLIGILTAVLIWKFWGLRELVRILLQVVLTLTLGASIFAGFIRRLEKAVE